MSKNTSIELDNNSLKILKEVDSIHRNSLINIGLALVKKTGYYKTLTGEGSEVLEEVVSLESLDTVQEKRETKTEVKEASQNWNDDDFF